jgi:hypothetical protein
MVFSFLRRPTVSFKTGQLQNRSASKQSLFGFIPKTAVCCRNLMEASGRNCVHTGRHGDEADFAPGDEVSHRGDEEDFAPH